MASVKVFIYLFTILFSLALTLAQDPAPGNAADSELPFLGGSRHRRSTTPALEEHENETEQDRLFFSLFSRRLISCNYQTQGGSTCTGCRVLQRCYPGNIGTVRTCTGLCRYCNNGRCSMTPGALCSATTPTTTTTTSTSTSTTTSSPTT